ncbi:MAG: phosphoenolpyruvate--protein phosphotransferase [Planctomycetaceae bacterium]|nr:phosphoenolpyruvate--protein phosphotransferase [Planctomycetaceae bacterium]|tara:strand:+ start:1068 stop:2816 length:1749 start_codon:yes stop_codon:yes gene_type:complete
MQIKRGIAVSPGVVTGEVVVLGTEDFRIPQRFVSIDAVETELGRFRSTLDAVWEEIEENERLAREQLGDQFGAIFGAHLQMARDPKLIAEIESLISEKSLSPEYASSRVLRRFARDLQNLGNQYHAERAVDIFDLEKRILRHLLGERREELLHLRAPVIVLAHNLTPSETAGLDREFVMGFATEVGGHTSHTAILAGALEIPAVVGLGHFLSDVSGGEMVIIDGNHGEVILEPDDETLAKYRDLEERVHSVTERLASLKTLPAETIDGESITLLGNIEFPEEAEVCRERGAKGIGLYRTEFLYLERNQIPSEEDHYEAYRKVIAAAPDHPVTIRTLDVGADKVPETIGELAPDVVNPQLGLRSVRLSLHNIPLFKTQLRAILRAAVDGDVRVMFPLVSNLMELRQARMILGDVIDDLEEQQVPFRRDVQVGIMVEVPAAVMLAEEFAQEVDFFSIGTNDLIQYTLAVDRADPSVANLYRSGDPSILRLIRNVVSAAAKHDVAVTVCGQMSSDPVFISLLIGMGIRQFSSTPHAIPEIKEVIRNLTIESAEQIAAHALTLDLARDVENYLRGELHRICPDLVL